MNKGFTLIELMIVVAIIGILASIALPAYQVYTIRAQLVESLTLTGVVKPKIAEFYEQHGTFPVDNTEAGLPDGKYLMGNYVKQVKVNNGAIEVTLGNKINTKLAGKILTIRPQYVKESPITPLAWLCGNADVVEGMTVAGENSTTLEPMFLPSACR